MSTAPQTSDPSASGPSPGSSRQGLPRWMKIRVPKGGGNRFTSNLLRQLELETVCEHARCPNRMECYASRTATFMILGDTCTRNCRFCSVTSGRPAPPDPDEPRRLAEAVARLKLKHVVITCVTRDDLPDGGAAHFCRCMDAVREVSDATIELLPSDLGHDRDSLLRIVNHRPDIFNHNTETVPRLYPTVRDPRTDYHQTLDMFRLIRRHSPELPLKTGLMLGLGETEAELLDTLHELHDAGCTMLTLGQYLRPSLDQLPVVKYYTPEEFQAYDAAARRIGFSQVAAGPMVRSSYHAKDMAARLDSAPSVTEPPRTENSTDCT